MTGLEESRQAICDFFMTRLWLICDSGSGLVMVPDGPIETHRGDFPQSLSL